MLGPVCIACQAVPRKVCGKSGLGGAGKTVSAPATRTAILCSLVQTCKHPHINPFVYLHDVIERVSTHPAPTYKIRQRHQTFHEAFGGENGSLRAPDPAVLLSVPRVRILFAPPRSLKFEAFSGEVRKPRACSDDAHGPSAPEKTQMVSRCASLRFSLCGRVIRCRCRLLANASRVSGGVFGLSIAL